MLVLLVPFLWILKPFWMTITLALVFAVALSPILSKIELHLKGQKKWALFTLITGLIFLLIIPFGLVLLKGSQLVIQQIQNLSTPESIARLKGYQGILMTHLESLKNYGLEMDSIQEHIWSLGEQAGRAFTHFIGNTFSQIPELILMVFVLLLSLISFLSMREKSRQFLEDIEWISKENRKKLLSAFKSCCQTVVFSSFVTGFLQALLTTLGAVIFTDADSVLVFFITFLFSFIPVIGAGPVSFVLAFAAFLEGAWGNGVGLLVLSGVTSVLDNVLRPYLLSGTTKIDGIWALFCTIGAVIMFGLPGLFLGPLIGGLTMDLIPILIDEF